MKSTLMIASAALTILLSPASADERSKDQTSTSDNRQSTQTSDADAQDNVVYLEVDTAEELERVIKQYASDGNTTAFEIDCTPESGNGYCSSFKTSCEEFDGGLSTNPDGSVHCSLNDGFPDN